MWLNWRDIKSPDAGGAEVFTHEVMRRLAIKGHEMSLFSARFPDSPESEILDGVNIMRKGNEYSVYNKAKQYYHSHNTIYDIVIDEINTKPFLTPTFVTGKPILALLHQLAREYWFYETSFPLNYIGYYYLEKKWLSCYRDIPTVTVSHSSRRDLEEIGFKRIQVVPQGLGVTPLPRPSHKETHPTVVFLGRLKRVKLPHHAIKAFTIIKKEIPDAKMWIIGCGYMRLELEKYDVRDAIFFGHLKNELKFELLAKAHLILVPAVREGWCMVVTEANAMGTPAVAYNVPGLRDSVRNGETGILVNENSPEALAHSAIVLLKNRELLNKYSASALNYSTRFNWDNTANEFEKFVKSCIA